MMSADTCVRLRKTRAKRTESTPSPPPIFFFLPSLSALLVFVYALQAHPFPQMLLVWMGHVTSFLFFWPWGSFCLRVRMRHPLPLLDKTPCLFIKKAILNSQLFLPFFFFLSNTLLDTHTHFHTQIIHTNVTPMLSQTDKKQRAEEASAECDWTLKELSDHRLFFL